MFCWEFNSEHPWKFFGSWHHYCDVICQQSTVYLWFIFSTSNLS